MAKHPRLHKRGNVFYARVSVPQDIKDTYGRKEIWKSLGTSEYQLALQKLRTEADPHFEMLFKEHRAARGRLAVQPLEALTDEQIRLVGDAHYVRMLEEDEEERIRGFDDDEFDAYVADLEYVDQLARELNARGGKPGFVQGVYNDILLKRGLDWRLAETSPSWPKISRSLIAATVKANEAKRKRNAGDVVETPTSQPISGQGQTKLSNVITEWEQERTLDKGGWASSTATANRLWTGRFIDVCGDTSGG